jgi:hypothetical protein
MHKNVIILLITGPAFIPQVVAVDVDRPQKPKVEPQYRSRANRLSWISPVCDPPAMTT